MLPPRKPTSDFLFLTERQKAVLDQLLHARTSKEIASTLGISETSVNRRIEVVRARLGGVTRHEVIRRYRLWVDRADAAGPRGRNETTAAAPCVESGRQILQLAETPPTAPIPQRDSEACYAAFEDPVVMSIEAPWKPRDEPRIVPGVLDGNNATLTRGAVIAILLAAIIASLVLILAAARALADAIG
ncbi:LuxR C-terminal-related transcriptional regulator [Sphingopyxis solisilvae]|uniref:LuxR C-terminal-related transcriptional regulator n=1 Tax=Sphingopyxis solisilvae TaxID=1886788 RepID=UPI001E467089|nr:LuxR C-terminal-related transcriptional regulator [Sphingopyxis solisilvae]